MFHHPAWAVGSYSSGPPAGAGELPKSKSTQPSSSRTWDALYCSYLEREGAADVHLAVCVCEDLPFDVALEGQHAHPLRRHALAVVRHCQLREEVHLMQNVQQSWGRILMA